jgi:hypothetical protein
MVRWLDAWLVVSQSFGWLVGWLDAWLVVSRSFGWLVGRSIGCSAGQLATVKVH